MGRLPVFPPRGILRGATPNLSAGRWFDANLMRWRGSQLQPIGGNAALAGADMDSPARDLLTWHDNNGTRWAAAGNEDALYAYRFDTQEQFPVLSGVGQLGAPGAYIGYGLGDYGTDTYGTPRDTANIGVSDVSAILGDIWSLDLFGEDLLVVPTQDGRLFRWKPSDPTTPASVVPNAPDHNAGVLVTDERHVVLIGAGGVSRQVVWSDQENPEMWTPALDNMAGDKMLETEGRPLSAVRVSGANLILTDNDVHLMRYVGPPYGYGINKIGANCGPISKRAISQSAFQTAWMGAQTFWQFNGAVVPLDCDVGDWLFSMMNRDFVGRVFACPNPTFAEHWWFWPSEGSTECDRYAAVNYADSAAPWIIGLMERSAGDIRGAMARPILGGLDGKIYIHEYGWTDNGATRDGLIYVETGDISLTDGADNRVHVTQIVQDFTGPADRVGYRFFTWEETNGPEFDTGVFPVTNDTGLTDARFSCRGFRMRIEALSDGPFAIGRTRLLTRQGGKR